MRVLINASNLKKGGGVQVALSLIEEFSSYSTFNFHLVVSDAVYKQLNIDSLKGNFSISRYNLYPTVIKAIFGYDSFLSNVEKEFKPDWVFTVFGPSYWVPMSKHLMGYAVPHYLYNDSPFFRIIPFKEKISVFALKLLCFISLSKSKNFYWVETEDVKLRLSKFLFINSSQIQVVSNTCHSVFNDEIPSINAKYDIFFANVSEKKLITVSANYLHKNLNIINSVVPLLKQLKVRIKFYLTLNKTEFDSFNFDTDYVVNLGPVDIIDCPYLYSRVDCLFLPTLLECFSASYVEAMKMNIPILTSDLSFARGVCGDAAEYFDPLDAEDITNKIIDLLNNNERAQELTRNGNQKLGQFLSSKERASKISTIFVD